MNLEEFDLLVKRNAVPFSTSFPTERIYGTEREGGFKGVLAMAYVFGATGSHLNTDAELGAVLYARLKDGRVQPRLKLTYRKGADVIDRLVHNIALVEEVGFGPVGKWLSAKQMYYRMFELPSLDSHHKWWMPPARLFDSCAYRTKRMLRRLSKLEN